jgi:excisionase family DNA binding protein
MIARASAASVTSRASESITVPHAAAIVGVTIPRMQQLLRTGRIEGWREGQQWKTTRQAVEAYLLGRQDLKPKARRACMADE